MEGELYQPEAIEPLPHSGAVYEANAYLEKSVLSKRVFFVTQEEQLCDLEEGSWQFRLCVAPIQMPEARIDIGHITVYPDRTVTTSEPIETLERRAQHYLEASDRARAHMHSTCAFRIV